MFNRFVSRLLKIGIGLFFLLIISHGNTESAWACSPSPGYIEPSIRQRVRAASFVIEGTAIQVSSEQYPYSAVFLVNKWYKGNGEDTITVSGFGGGGDCRSWVLEGFRLILFADGNVGSGEIHLNYLGIYDAAIPATPETINKIIRVISEDTVLRFIANWVNLTVIISVIIFYYHSRKSMDNQINEVPEKHNTG